MVVSVQTASDVLETVLKYVPEDQLPYLIQELKSIPGNQSYRDTIALIDRIAVKR